MPMAVNLGRVVIYNEEFPSTNLPDPLIKWSCKIMETILATVSQLLQGLWSLNLTKLRHTIINFNPSSHANLSTRGHLRSCDKLKTFYLNNHNTYGYQTRQGGYIQ